MPRLKPLLRRLAAPLRGRLADARSPWPWADLLTRPRFTPGSCRVGDDTVHYVDAASCASAGRAIFEERIYDFPPPPGDRPVRIVDCGANIGLGVLFWARRFKRAEIVAFEPDPQVFATLRRNVQTWGLAGQADIRVELVNAAVGGETGTLQFLPDHADGGRLTELGAAPEAAGEEPSARRTVGVDVVRLGERLTEPVDLLKVDIEGAEADLLADLDGQLDRVERAFVEVHGIVGRPQRLDEIAAVLRRAGFRTLCQPEYCPPRPFLERTPTYGMDNRVNLYAVRT